MAFLRVVIRKSPVKLVKITTVTRSEELGSNIRPPIQKDTIRRKTPIINDRVLAYNRFNLLVDIYPSRRSVEQPGEDPPLENDTSCANNYSMNRKMTD